MLLTGSIFLSSAPLCGAVGNPFDLAVPHIACPVAVTTDFVTPIARILSRGVVCFGPKFAFIRVLGITGLPQQERAKSQAVLALLYPVCENRRRKSVKVNVKVKVKLFLCFN
jgi:hypothetical protein